MATIRRGLIAKPAAVEAASGSSSAPKQTDILDIPERLRQGLETKPLRPLGVLAVEHEVDPLSCSEHARPLEGEHTAPCPV